MPVRVEAEGQFATILRLNILAILLGLLATELCVLGSGRRKAAA